MFIANAEFTAGIVVQFGESSYLERCTYMLLLLRIEKACW